MATYGLHYGYGVFLPHMAKEFQVGYSTLSAPFSIYLALYTLLSLVTGRLTDRFGPRLVVLAGGVFLGTGYGLLGYVREIWQLYLALCLVAALGMSAAFIPISATVIKWFVRRRGLALAIVATGNAAAAIFGPGLASYLIPLLGWRTAITTLALVVGVLICGSALLLAQSPEALGLRPDGDNANGKHGHPTNKTRSKPEPAWTLREALSTTAYWVMLLTFLVSWFTLFLPYLHLPTLLSDIGHSPARVTQVIGAMGVGGLIGRFAVGWLSDSIGRVLSLHAALVLQILACLIFSQSQSHITLGLAGMMFAAGSSSATIMYLAIVGDTFGRLHAGALSGFIFAVAGSLSAAGPYIAGVLRDETGNYQLTFLLAAGCNVVAVIIFLFFRPPQSTG